MIYRWIVTGIAQLFRHNGFFKLGTVLKQFQIYKTLVSKKGACLYSFWGAIFQQLVGLTQTIYHRIANKIAHISYLYQCFRIHYRLGAVLKINSSVFRIFMFGGLFIGQYFQTVCRNETNDTGLKRY